MTGEGELKKKEEKVVKTGGACPIMTTERKRERDVDTERGGWR